jgi:predicted aminopeptidase
LALLASWRFKSLRQFAASLLCLAAPAGCTPFNYLAQAGFGQLNLSLDARSIEDAARDPHTPARIRALLSEVGHIKQFGERHGLTPTANYTQYVGLDRPFVVWVVSAAEPLRFEMKSWRFPIVGSVPYLGWFERDDAVEFADDLGREGWDVDLRGAAAYSTLGWFNDPVLSSMILDGDEALGELANTVLHESVHATLYIPNQSLLNENIATFIGDGLTELYLDQAKGPQSAEKIAYMAGEAEGERRVAAMHDTYKRLDTLYRSSRPVEAKLKEKGEILSALREKLGFRRPLNNATLAQFKTYHSSGAELQTLFAACQKSWVRLLGALKRLGPQSFSEAQQRDLAKVILPLAHAGCADSPRAPASALPPSR